MGREGLEALWVALAGSRPKCEVLQAQKCPTEPTTGSHCHSIAIRELGMNTQGWPKKKKSHTITRLRVPIKERCGVTATRRVRVAGFGQVLKNPPLPSRGRCDSSTEICGGIQGRPGVCGVQRGFGLGKNHRGGATCGSSLSGSRGRWLRQGKQD